MRVLLGELMPHVRQEAAAQNAVAPFVRGIAIVPEVAISKAYPAGMSVGDDLEQGADLVGYVGYPSGLRQQETCGTVNKRKWIGKPFCRVHLRSCSEHRLAGAGFRDRPVPRDFPSAPYV